MTTARNLPSAIVKTASDALRYQLKAMFAHGSRCGGNRCQRQARGR